MLTKRRLIVFLFDLSLIAASLVLAFLLRFDFSIPLPERELFLDCLMVVLVVKPLVFISTGFYLNIWRYASLQDAIEMFKGVIFSSILAVFAVLFMRHFSPIPRSIFLIDAILLFSLLAASRLVWRILRESHRVVADNEGTITLVVGAGEAGSMLLKEIRRHPASTYNVVGFVDDDKEKHGMKLHGIPVLGAVSQLNSLIKAHDVKDVVIAMPSADGKAIRGIIECCRNANVRFSTLPSINNLINGKVTVSQVKKVDIEDLLGRDQVSMDRDLIGAYLTGKRVLVTGAAGSIGSEICRQVAQFDPEKLVLLDQAETPLYEIEKELVAKCPQIKILPLMADVRDREQIFVAFDSYQPQVVFHAAAYKHVPMMEYNPVQAAFNNVFGSKNVVDAACHCKAENFVMISTDKAVNPTNIMGATKRAAEIYVQSISSSCRTRCTTVRFGNVLGSNGSVIPLFKEQIANGGPVTVTDKRVIRYFMTIPEATQLVLQAGGMSSGSEILVLDMGDPVRIVDLAESLIRLSGFTPYDDIDIVFTGLRPGEKLFEELLVEGEGILPTSHEKIRVLEPVHFDITAVKSELDAMLAAVRSSDVGAVVDALKRLVPEFRPAYHFKEAPPVCFKRARPDLFPPNDRKVLPFHQRA